MKRSKNFIPHVAQCEYFTVDKLYLDGEIMRNMTGIVKEDSFANVLFLENFFKNKKESK